jgi:hypothetical protein
LALEALRVAPDVEHEFHAWESALHAYHDDPSGLLEFQCAEELLELCEQTTSVVRTTLLLSSCELHRSLCGTGARPASMPNRSVGAL